MPSTLEILPNELLLMIYLYLDPYYVLLAFLQLNKRFERTLTNYKQDIRLSSMHYAEARRLSKDLLYYFHKFVTSLTLDDEYTGGLQVEHFLLPIYPNLRSLHIRCCDRRKLTVRIPNLVYMPELKTLKIDQIRELSLNNISEKKEDKTVQLMKNTLYGIARIEQVHLPGTIFDIRSQYLEATCNEIQQLSLTETTLLNLFFCVLPFSQDLRYLSANIDEDYDFEEEHFTMLTFLPLRHLTSLHLNVDSSVHFPLLTELLLHLAPDTLECFSLKTTSELEDAWANGEDWREVLSQLPRLTKFNLFLEQPLMHGTENDLNLNDIYSSFASDWWVKEKQWFITILRADLPASKTIFEHTKIFVHSDPLEKHISIDIPLSSIKQILCTRPNDLSVADRYATVHELGCQGLRGLGAFPNLKYLTLFEESCTLPTTSNEILNLKYLTHLTLSKFGPLNIDTLFSQLKNGARHLRSLAIVDKTIFKCFLQQSTWRCIQEFELSIKKIEDANIIERLAYILPDLRFLRLGQVKYDDFQLILCDTLEYCRHLVGLKTKFSYVDRDEKNNVRTAFIENIDEWLLDYTNLDIGICNASFDNNNTEFILWL